MNKLKTKIRDRNTFEFGAISFQGRMEQKPDSDCVMNNIDKKDITLYVHLYTRISRRIRPRRVKQLSS